MSDTFANPRGQVGILTKADGSPQYLYAWEKRGGSAYAILWVLIDRPGKTLAYVATNTKGQWVSLADLARETPEAIGAAEGLDHVELQGGTPYTAPLQGFTVYKDAGTGATGFQSAEVFLDPMELGAPTLLAQLGRVPDTIARPDSALRLTPGEAATSLGLPLSGSDVAFADDGGSMPIAPTAPPGFGDVGGKSPPPVGKLSTGTAVTALVLLAVAGGLLLFSQRAS